MPHGMGRRESSGTWAGATTTLASPLVSSSVSSVSGTLCGQKEKTGTPTSSGHILDFLSSSSVNDSARDYRGP